MSWQILTCYIIVDGEGCKMRYYWVVPEDLRDKCNIEFCFFVTQIDFPTYDILVGKSMLHYWPTNARFEFERHNGYVITECFDNDMNWPIYSTRITRWLQEKQDYGLEYLPAQIVSTNSEMVLDNYKVVNITHVIDVIDLNHSKYSMYDTGDLMMVLPSFKRKVLAELHPTIFKTKMNEIPIYVSEEFKHFWEEEKLAGLDFHEIRQV